VVNLVVLDMPPPAHSLSSRIASAATCYLTPDTTGRALLVAHAIISAPAKDGGTAFALATDLGCDAIYRFRIDRAGQRLVPLDPPLVNTPPGAGPLAAGK
jgi:hypothetical protein